MQPNSLLCRKGRPTRRPRKCSIEQLLISRRPSYRPDRLRNCLNGRPLLHLFVGSGQYPPLTRKIAAFGEVRLIVIRATIEDVQAHVRATEYRCKTDRVSILSQQNIPELTRVVTALDEVWLIIVRATIEDVQAHINTTKHR